MKMSDNVDALGEPYPGLRSFRRDETHIFFGREGTISDMVDRLAAHRFLAVTGHSGSGKSSLVRTGLIDALDRGLLVEAGSDWCVADFAPGGQPFSRLTAALVKAVGGSFSPQELGLIEAKLARGPLGLLAWLDEIDFKAETNVLLLVDQFEEIFRYRQGQTGDDIDAFVALLLASAKQRQRRIYVVITMRSDFLGDCARFTDLAETINDGQFLTPRLTRDQCREAIEGPAAVYGGRVEPALVTRMLNDMGGNPDQLPLMQHILMLLWQEARERAGDTPQELTLADYHRLGGIGSAGPETDARGAIEAKKPSRMRRLFGWFRSRRAAVAAMAENRNVNGALSDHADLVLSELTPEQQGLAGSLFRALTESEGTGGRDVRRPIKLAQAVAITEAPAGDLTAVIEAFRAPGRHFLTPLAPIPLTPETIIDISHESLIRQWVKLRQWVREEFQSAEMYRYVERRAKQWKDGLGNLLAKLDLAVARRWRKDKRPNAAWAERYGDAFDLAMGFLRKSERHRRWRRGIVAATASTVLLVVLSTTAVALYLMAVVTTGLSYVNPADEWSNFDVKPQAEMKRDVGTNTPLTIPGGRVIATAELEAALDRKTLEDVPFLAIDAWRRANWLAVVPGSIYIEYAGDYGEHGSFDDEIQKKLKDELAKLTNNNLNMPLVFFCQGAKCWESYNAALRAINLGYTKIYWYRGGVASWYEAHRSYPIDFSRIPARAIETGLSSIWSAVRDTVWPDPGYYYQRGLDYAAKQQYDNAIDDFTKAIKLSPDNPNAYFERARAYASKGEFDRAIADLDKTVAIDGGKTADVEREKRDPKYAAFYVSRGNAQSEKREYGLAIKEYDKAIQLAPNNADAYYRRGAAYYGKNDYARAIEDHTKAITLDPKLMLAYNGRGHVYYSMGDYDRAILDYGQAIALRPKEKVLYSNRGNAYFSKRDYDHAILDFDAAIAIDPKYSSAYQSRGNAYAAKEDYEKAISDLTQAIALDPGEVGAIVDRSAAYLGKRDYTHAIQDTNDAINRQPTHVGALWVRGRARFHSEAADQAVGDLQAALKVAPKAPLLVIWLQLARLRTGHEDLGELTANAKALDQTRWPWPVVGLFLGTLAPEAVMAAAQSPNPIVKNDQLCEATFYVGVYHGTKGDKDAARRLLQAAVDICPKSFVEYVSAKIELDRIR